MKRATKLKTHKSWQAQSCHEIGYAWEIDAPSDMTEEQIEAVVNAVIDYTDTPDEDTIHKMIRDGHEVDGVTKAQLRKIDIYVESVHRDAFSQNIEEV